MKFNLVDIKKILKNINIEQLKSNLKEICSFV